MICVKKSPAPALSGRRVFWEWRWHSCLWRIACESGKEMLRWASRGFGEMSKAETGSPASGQAKVLKTRQARWARAKRHADASRQERDTGCGDETPLISV